MGKFVLFLCATRAMARKCQINPEWKTSREFSAVALEWWDQLRKLSNDERLIVRDAIAEEIALCKAEKLLKGI